MDYDSCLNELRKLGHELKGVKFELETIRHVLSELGDPHLKTPCIIVAGTNGKGSTCSMLASILQQAGLRTGLYISPHLIRVNERIRIDGSEISDDDFASALTEVFNVAARLAGRGVLERSPSYFEAITASAFLYFASRKTEVTVLEVGMGGRLDATNVAEPLLSVITNVAMDHEQFLGNTLEAIAREKAGVIKPGRPVVSACGPGAPAEVVRRRAEELGCELVETGSAAKVSNLSDAEGKVTFGLDMMGSRFPKLALSLAGGFQLKNAVAAVAAAQLLQRQGLHIGQHAIARGLASAHWPGRLEEIHRSPLVLLDGAHNPAAALELAAFVREHFPGRTVRLVYASMRDKAIEEITGALFPLAREIYLTRPDIERAAAPEEILKRAQTEPQQVMIELEPARALEEAIQASSEQDIILVAGSLFLVGAILKARRDGDLALDRPARGAVSLQPI